MSGRRGKVYYRDHLAGNLEETASGYRFTYDPSYLSTPGMPDISLTLPKQKEPFEAPVLFPFFFGLLAEGVQKEINAASSKSMKRMTLDGSFGPPVRIPSGL